MEVADVELMAVTAEGMKIGLTFLLPVDELDAQLERPLGGAQEVAFVNTEQPVKADNRR